MHRTLLYLTAASLLSVNASSSQAPLPAEPEPPAALAQADRKPAPAQAPELIPPPDLPRWSLPGDAVRVARADKADIVAGRAVNYRGEPVGIGQLPFIRWVWVESGEKEDYQSACLALAIATGHSPADTRPTLVGGILGRIDLSEYYPRIGDLARAVEAWEELRFDPGLSYLFTKDTLRFLSADERRTVRFRRPEAMAWEQRGGRWVPTGRGRTEVKVEELKDFTAERVDNGEARRAGIAELQLACLTEAPVVRAEYFAARALDTIRGQKDGQDTVFTTIYGGLYNDFRGIRKANKRQVGEGGTDLDQLFFDLGVGSKQERFKQVFDRTQADQAAVVYRRRVNGKKCRIRWFPTLSAQPTESASVLFLTEDLLDEDIDLGDDPIANLVTARPAAFEAIWTGANGQLGYALYDGKGKLLEEAAPQIATDRSVPQPHTTRLRAAISCLRCHGSEGDGWQSFENDTLTLLRRRFAVFGDLTDANQAAFETIGRLRLQYRGDPAWLLNDLRKSLARSTIQATGAWEKSAGGRQLDVSRLGAAGVSRLYARERYDPVDAAAALRRLGAAVPANVTADKATAMLNELLPAETAPVQGGIPREDPRLMGVLSGIPITAYDWNLAYSFALDRALAVQRAKEKQP